MGKIVWVFIGIMGVVFSSERVSLEQECLHCHQIQQIPNRLIYKRYLKKYSTANRMGKVMLKYLKNPHPSDSIMPPQFFLKFPMKEALHLEDRVLKIYIDAYIKKFDIKKQLTLQK